MQFRGLILKCAGHHIGMYVKVVNWFESSLFDTQLNNVGTLGMEGWM